MEKDTMVLYSIAGCCFLFALFNGILFVLKEGVNFSVSLEECFLY